MSNELVEYETRWKYAHMKPADIEIWERFIKQNPKAYQVVQYDFNVGDPPPFNPLMPDGEDLNQDALYRLKIDVVGYNGNDVDIIEIKPNAGPSTIGQVKGYRELYIRDELPVGMIGMTIITDRIRPNMEYLCRNEGIKLVLV